MKKYIIIAVAVLIAVTYLFILHKRLNTIKEERDKYRNNTTTLLGSVEQYKINEELNAARVGELKLRLSQYENYRAEDAKLIKQLKRKNKDLADVTTAQTQTINKLSGKLRDTIIIKHSDTIIAQCVNIDQPYIYMNGCITADKQFTGEVITRDSILITETIEYKRALGFLWKTKRIKSKDYDIVSRNPHTKILNFEVVTIDK